LKITESEWAAFCKDFDDATAKFNVPEAQRMIVSGRRTQSRTIEPNQQKAIGIVELWSLRCLPANHVELLEELGPLPPASLST